MDVRVGERVTARTFPADDGAFGEQVREALEAEAEDDATIEDLATAVEGQLRELHPRIVARPRTALAGFGQDATLYVFRDGSIEPEEAAAAEEGGFDR